jgi:hypothetical protein
MRHGAFAAVAALAAALVASRAAAQVIDSLDAVGPYLDLCVTRELRAQGFGPRAVTLRLSFRRDGTIIGNPVVTYSRPTRGEPDQERFIKLMTAAFRSCAPLPFSTALGAAIAGKIFTFNYTLTNAKDEPI